MVNALTRGADAIHLPKKELFGEGLARRLSAIEYPVPGFRISGFLPNEGAEDFQMVGSGK